MDFSNIKAALVKAYVTGAFGLPTAYENKDLKPDNTQPWASVLVVPNQPEVVTLSDHGQDEHTGFMQINLNYPLNKGDGAILQKADAIRAFFKAGKAFHHSNQQVVIRNCGRSQGRTVDGLYQIILTITYYARTARS